MICQKLLTFMKAINCDKHVCISPYSVWMRENTDQNNSEYGHFLHSVFFQIHSVSNNLL